MYKHGLQDRPKVAIIGRPNVGKSTLFNRIIQSRKAVVEEFGPTTRDRISCIVRWLGVDFELIDTPGMDSDKKEKLHVLIKKQVMFAIKEADQIIFLCDGKTGIVALDYQICSILRKYDKKIILAVNKIDNKEMSKNALDFYNLGMGDPVPISSLHGIGIGNLLDIITARYCSNMPQPGDQRPHLNIIKLAVIGKPNVGKSSFVNSVLGEERTVVCDEPGTTRDSVDTYFKKGNRSFVIIDTAGIRSRQKIKDAVTYFSILRTEETIKKSDVAIILIDGSSSITKEDYRIIDFTQRSLRPFIVAVNKWDLCRTLGVDKEKYEDSIKRTINFMHNAQIFFISSMYGENISDVIDAAYNLAEKSKRNFSTSQLNSILRTVSIRSTKAYSVSQVGSFPPQFEVIVKNPAAVKDSISRYIANTFRKKLELDGVPVVIKFRKKIFKHNRRVNRGKAISFERS